MGSLWSSCGCLRPWRIAVSLACLAPNASRGQVVNPRTIPVQQSGQFDIFPSKLAGMAGVSLALDDTLLDPFVNPAKAIRVGAVMGLSVPGFHHISQGGGGGNTIPAGVLFSRRGWAGGGLLASQRLSEIRPVSPTGARIHPHNEYFSALLARQMSRGVTLGLSAYSARLGGLDALSQLYAGSDGVEVSGRQFDFRAGLLKEWRNHRSLELLLLHGKSDITHDAVLLTQTWDPIRRQFSSAPRLEHNDDRTRFWGLHTESTLPLDTLGSRIGLLFTANRITHPKIPNYPLVNIPRDPGVTHGFNVGIGIGTALGGTMFGLDLVYEPIWTNTWATTGENIETDDGNLVPAGSKTIENWFRFSNVKVRAGLSREIRLEADSALRFVAQVGIAFASTSYSLLQQDNVALTRRDRQFEWVDWEPTIGFALRVRSFEARYALQATCGPNSCVFARGDDVSLSPDTPRSVGIAVPVNGPADFHYGSLVSHRFTITLGRR